MKGKVSLLVLATALAGLVAMVPLGASSGGTKRFVVGFHVMSTGPNSDAGTFVAAGAVSDSGTVTATYTITPAGNDEARIEGIQVLSGQAGTITVRFRGTIFPASASRVTVRGTAVIASGTGAYTDLRGKNTWLLAADFSTGTGNGIGTEDWKLR